MKRESRWSIMYYPVGWPRLLRLPPRPEDAEDPEIVQVVANRDKILTAILTENALQIWYIKVRTKKNVFHVIKIAFYRSGTSL